ncbi:DUF4129 domain-containing protein [Halosegnis sp.]|uniref:DUF4129 domain-containing protein n=1 Tax=Halosegnis sp. TaxID=2864959 RepID=UPI0035D4452B
MNRRLVAAALLAVLAVAGLGVAAASLDTLDDGAAAPGFGSGDGGVDLFGDRAPTEPTDRPVLGPLVSLLLGIGFLLFVAVGLYSLWRALGLRGLTTATAAGVVFLALVYLLFRSAQPPDPGRAGNRSGNTSGFGIEGSLADGAPVAQSVDPPVVFAALVVLTVAGAALLFAWTGDDDRAVDATEPATDGDVAAVARAAGAAADRIAAGTAVDNEVYRAWREMTAHLDVEDPETSTPTEFAEAAVDAGMASDDVEALTTLFAEIRYGPGEPTAEREQRALARLRRIERRYTGGDTE